MKQSVEDGTWKSSWGTHIFMTLASTKSEEPGVVPHKCDALARVAGLRAEIARLNPARCQYLVI